MDGGTSEYIKLYGIDASSPEGQNFLFIFLVKQSASLSYSAYKDIFKIYADRLNGNGRDTYRVDLALFDPPLAKLKAHDIEGAFKDSIQLGAALFEMDPKDLQWVQNILSKTDKEGIQTEFLEWWMSLASLCASREDLKSLFRENPSLFGKNLDSISRPKNLLNTGGYNFFHGNERSILGRIKRRTV